MTRSALFFFLPLIPILFMACDEELPPQKNPQDLFVASASTQYRYNAEARPTESSIDIFIVYKNLYDETLEDVAAMKGTIKIEWIVSPEERGSIIPFRTDLLTMDNLFYATGFNFSNNHLSIDPGDSIILRYHWDLKTDDSTRLLDQVKYSQDRSCTVYKSDGVDTRRISYRQQFRLSSTFVVFQRSGVITMPAVEFSSCWIRPHGGEVNPCNQPNPENPCNLLP